MARLPREAVEAIARIHFDDQGEVIVQKMVAIAFAESGGETDAIGDNWQSGHQSVNSPARYDDGLWQINSQWGFSRNRLRLDPAYNAEVARYIFDRQGLNAWTTYRFGLWERFYRAPEQLSPTLTFGRLFRVAHDVFFPVVLPGEIWNARALRKHNGRERYMLERRR